jgi:hypothetical protein
MSRNLASKAAGDVMTLLPGRLSGISRRAILAMSLIVGVATFAKFGYLGRAVGEMMTDCIYDAQGYVVGFVRGRYIHDMHGHAIGQLNGTSTSCPAPMSANSTIKWLSTRTWATSGTSAIQGIPATPDRREIRAIAEVKTSAIGTYLIDCGISSCASRAIAGWSNLG